jgi:hypothetical protein
MTYTYEWPVGTKMKVVSHGTSFHRVRIGSIVTYLGTYVDVIGCEVSEGDLLEPLVHKRHSANGLSKDRKGRNFYRNELEPLEEDLEDLYV